MRRTCHLVIMIALSGALTVGFAETANAQQPIPSTFQNTSQFCSQSLEPQFANVNIPMSHSTCVSLMNGGEGHDAGVCKWARDAGAIGNNEVGECIADGIPDLRNKIIASLVASGVPWRPEPVGPSVLSFAVFACLLGAWLAVQVRNRRRIIRP